MTCCYVWAGDPNCYLDMLDKPQNCHLDMLDKPHKRVCRTVGPSLAASSLQPIASAVSKKIGVLICSLNFGSPKVPLYLYKTSIWPWMTCCCYVWAGDPNCYLDMLDKPQKQVCRTVGSSRAASSLLRLTQHRNVASLRIAFTSSFSW